MNKRPPAGMGRDHFFGCDMAGNNSRAVSGLEPSGLAWWNNYPVGPTAARDSDSVFAFGHREIVRFADIAVEGVSGWP